MNRENNYKWRVGDVFAKGQNRWEVVRVDGEKAVLRSCSSSWATTIPLSFNEWNADGDWTLEARP